MVKLANTTSTLSKSNPAQRKTVLFVDCDHNFLMQQKVALEAAGYYVLPAENEEQAESVMKQLRPDLAVLDIMMGQADAGFVLSRQIKKADPTLPVILISSVMSQTGLDFDAITAEERSWIKADVMLAKPVRSEQLTREIDRLLLN